MHKYLSACAVVLATLFVTPAHAQTKPDETLRVLNNLHQEMATCIAYYETLKRCLADNPKYKETSAGYGIATEKLFEMSFEIGKQIGLSDDAAQSRLTMAAQDMMQLIENNCGNISSLLSRHSKRCLEVSNDPLKAVKLR